MGMLQCEGKPGFTYFNYSFSVRSSLQISFLNAFCIKNIHSSYFMEQFYVGVIALECYFLKGLKRKVGRLTG